MKDMRSDDSQDDEFIQFVGRVFPDEKLPPEVLRLKERQRMLRSELIDIEEQLVTTRKDLVLLRRLPSYFWLPLHWTYGAMNRLPAIQQSAGDPELFHWRHHAGWMSFGINSMLWLLYLSVLLALLQILL